MKTEANDSIHPSVRTEAIPNDWREVDVKITGLTKREYFAASAGIQNEVDEMLKKPNPDYLTDITGVQQPKEDFPVKTKDLREWGKYWFDVEAALKVIKADALIAALKSL